MRGLSAAAPALAAPWNGTDSINPTPQNGVYIIDSPETLAGFRDWISAGINSTDAYRLTADIDLNGKEWLPIGTASPFQGQFEGGGHTVSNFTINDRTYTNNPDLRMAGLFGNVSGESANISYLSVTDFVININVSTSGTFYAGGLAGLLQYGSSVTNCRAAGSVSIFSAVDANPTFPVGGLVGGLLNNSRIEYSSAAVSVSASSSNSKTNFRAGGLLGTATNSTASIVNCSATGSVSVSSVNASTSTNAGGLIGYWSSSSGSVSYSFATGSVSVSASSSSSSIIANAGGFVGQMAASNNVAYCYATGGVSASAFTTDDVVSGYRATCRAGGFAGFISGAVSISHNFATGGVSSSASNSYRTTSDAPAESYAGGFVGYMSAGALIENSYATGRVLSSASNTCLTASAASKIDSWAGGFIGYQEKGDITNSYATGRVFSSASPSSGVPDAQAGAFAGVRNSGSSIIRGYFDRQAAGMSAGLGSGDLVSYDVTAKSSAEMFNIFAADSTNWRSVNAFYPQIAALADYAGTDGLSRDIRQMSALSAVPMRFDTSAGEDTSAAVAHSPLAPARTPGVSGVSLPVTWTSSPDLAVKNGYWNGGQERIFAPQTPGPLADAASGRVSGAAELTARIETPSGKTMEKVFYLTFDGNNADFSFTPTPDITLRHTFEDTEQSDLVSVKPLPIVISNDRNVTLEALLTGAGANDNFLLYEETAEQRKVVARSVGIAPGNRKNFYVIPQLNLPVGNYAANVTVSGDGGTTNLYSLALNVLSDSPGGNSAVTRLMLSTRQIEIAPGETRTLYAQLSPAPDDLAEYDVSWVVSGDADVVAQASEEVSWMDLWGLKGVLENSPAEFSDSAGFEKGVSRAADDADGGAIAKSKLVVTANKAGAVTVTAQLNPPLTDGANPEDSCEVKVVTESKTSGGGGGGGGGGCSAGGALPAAMIFFLPITFCLLYKGKNR